MQQFNAMYVKKTTSGQFKVKFMVRVSHCGWLGRRWGWWSFTYARFNVHQKADSSQFRFLMHIISAECKTTTDPSPTEADNSLNRFLDECESSNALCSVMKLNSTGRRSPVQSFHALLILCSRVRLCSRLLVKLFRSSYCYPAEKDC